MDVTQIISNLGFPIACVIAMAYYIKELTKQHRDEVDNLRTAIENNTLIVTKLYEKLCSEKGDD